MNPDWFINVVEQAPDKVTLLLLVAVIYGLFRIERRLTRAEWRLALVMSALRVPDEAPQEAGD